MREQMRNFIEINIKHVLTVKQNHQKKIFLKVRKKVMNASYQFISKLDSGEKIMELEYRSIGIKIKHKEGKE